VSHTPAKPLCPPELLELPPEDEPVSVNAQVAIPLLDEEVTVVVDPLDVDPLLPLLPLPEDALDPVEVDEELVLPPTELPPEVEAEAAGTWQFPSPPQTCPEGQLPSGHGKTMPASRPGTLTAQPASTRAAATSPPPAFTLTT
jgi:hypothetical protein